MNAGSPVPDLPPYSLDVQALDLGPGVKAVGLELLETESREPVNGAEAAEIWSAALVALAAKEPYVIDFFSHVDRVREFCGAHGIAMREAASRCLVVPQPSVELLRQLIARFESETFGARVGPTAATGDSELENELSRRGLDAYQQGYGRYTCCAICEPNDGWITLLSDSLWPSEVIRRFRPALQRFHVYMARPQ